MSDGISREKAPPHVEDPENPATTAPVAPLIRRLAEGRGPGAAAGVVGPAAFVGGWLFAGSVRPGYSAVREQISQLARLGAPNREIMTVAFICFGVTVPLFGPVLDKSLGTRKALTGTLSLAGLATLGVAAVPLSRAGGSVEDVAHGTFATLGYLGMALSPMIGAVALHRRRSGARSVLMSSLVGTVSAASLAATPFVPAYVGLLQRLGLGVVDAWIVAMAVSIIARRDHLPA